MFLEGLPLTEIRIILIGALIPGPIDHSTQIRERAVRHLITDQDLPAPMQTRVSGRIEPVVLRPEVLEVLEVCAHQAECVEVAQEVAAVEAAVGFKHRL